MNRSNYKGFNASYFANQDDREYPQFLTDAFGKDIKSKLGKCQRYQVDGLTPGITDSCQLYVEKIRNNDYEVTQCDYTELVHDQGLIRSSLKFDFGFVCDDAKLKSIYNAVYMGGMLAGSFLLGIFSDRFGRMSAMVLSVILMSVTGTLSGLAGVAPLYGVLRFGTGMGAMGCIMTAYIMGLENTTPSHIVKTNAMIQLGFMFGQQLYTLEAYFLREWRVLQIVAHAPLILVAVVWFFVPESARWLMTKKRYDEAEKVISKMAEANKAKVPNDLFKVSQKKIKL